MSEIVNIESLPTLKVEKVVAIVAIHMSVHVEAEDISENMSFGHVAETVPLDSQAEDISKGMSSGQVAVAETAESVCHQITHQQYYIDVLIATSDAAVTVNHDHGEEVLHIVNKEPSLSIDETDSATAAMDELSLQVKERVTGMSPDPESEVVIDSMLVMDDSDRDKDYNLPVMTWNLKKTPQ